MDAALALKVITSVSLKIQDVPTKLALRKVGKFIETIQQEITLLRVQVRNSPVEEKENQPIVNAQEFESRENRLSSLIKVGTSESFYREGERPKENEVSQV